MRVMPSTPAAAEAVEVSPIDLPNRETVRGADDEAVTKALAA